MKRTIIYVFGPKRLSAKYYENKEIRREEGGWLKIGQTSEENDAVDKKESAMRRIKTEVRTGIPEVSQLFDVFEYPYREGNNDDVIRTLLAEDIYTLENSKSNNRELGLDKYDIKAGREFVYGATRSQVKNALAKYQVSDKWDATIISQWLENKLKSLRPWLQWKPSDEEMEALDRAQAELCSTEYNKPICDLIDALNKLKE